MSKADPRFRYLNTNNMIWLGLTLRLCVAVWNGFFGPGFGAGPDAAGFHQGAVAHAHNQGTFLFEPQHVYMYALGAIYRWTTDSLFLGSCLSVAAWFASAIVVRKTLACWSVPERNQALALFVYAVLPSSILLSAITTREAYEMLALSLAAYSMLKVWSEKSNLYWLLLLASVLALGLLHGALLLVGLVIATIAVLSACYKHPEDVPPVALVGALFVLLVLAYASSSIILTVVLNREPSLAIAIQNRLDSWQQGARAYYPIGVRLTSDWDLIYFAPAALFHYWFEPLPWRIGTLSDLGVFLENVFRTLLLWMAVAGAWRQNGKDRLRQLSILLIYLIAETIWALGTINWGTAVRHKLPGFGLLVVAAFANYRSSRSPAD